MDEARPYPLQERLLVAVATDGDAQVFAFERDAEGRWVYTGEVDRGRLA